MSETKPDLSQDKFLSLRAVRILTGLLVMLWLFVHGAIGCLLSRANTVNLGKVVAMRLLGG